MRLDSIIIRAMHEAIKEAQTEQLILSSVNQQRELLKDFFDWAYYQNEDWKIGRLEMTI